MRQCGRMSNFALREFWAGPNVDDGVNLLWHLATFLLDELEPKAQIFGISGASNDCGLNALHLDDHTTMVSIVDI